MSQGKAWDKEQVVELLKPKFQLGYSVNKACELINLPASTFKTWLETDDELRLKVNAWQNEISDMARKVWQESIVTGIEQKNGTFDKYTPAKEWLERREKKEFSTRTEVTGEDGQLITVGLVQYSQNDPHDNPKDMNADTSTTQLQA